LLYLNADGRIHEAVKLAEANGGVVKEPIHPIGPNGFRAIIIDSEGNRVALHSHKDL
jgi:predicted enzyme related to lactoylglutathione lyase